MAGAAPIIDRVISYFSPRSGYERARFRKLEGILLKKRRFEAAGTGNRTSGWHAPNTGPNAEILPSLARLRSRSRDLVRNNPYAKRAVEVISSNVVGYGIVPQQKNKKFDDAWKEWAESPSCDVDGLNNFYGMQALVMREIAEAGEVLVRRVYAPSSDKMTVPIQLQIIESDMIYDAISFTKAENGNVIKYGIEFDSRGRRVAYYLYPEHPGELNYLGANFKPIRVPAKEILHVYRMDRAGQMRGIPWGASVLLKLRDFDDYEDAQLVRQKIAACFAGFLIDKDGSGDAKDETGLERITPGLITDLPPGKEISFGNPPSVGLDYAPYAAVNLRGVATGYGVTYEALTQDYSQVNFSSGRMGWLEFHRNISQWQWHTLIPNFCQKVWEWFVEAADLSGIASAKRIVPITWTPPRREMIDPTKETDAKIAAIRAGLTTLSEAIREQGNDPDKQLEEMKKDNELLDKYGLKLDSDSRQPKATSSPTQETPPSDKNLNKK